MRTVCGLFFLELHVNCFNLAVIKIYMYEENSIIINDDGYDD